MVKIEKFYHLSPDERKEYLLNAIPDLQPFTDKKLAEKIADNMIENYFDSYSIPLGLATNFMINEKLYHIPMANEEPSVIAAASNGAKRVGNIKTSSQSRELIGQIVFADVEDVANKKQKIEQSATVILDKAKELSLSMVKRGGGPVRIWAETFDNFLTIYLAFNPCDAMGANIMNSVLEGIAHEIESLIRSNALLRILSNYQEESLSIAQVAIPIQSLAKDEQVAWQMAKKISQASQYAKLDVYRATTHNKGIMNGIGAVLIATGNDWRAVDACVHAFASRTGKYQSLSDWWIDETHLKGKIALPLPVATVGGTISVHPDAQRSLQILGNPTARELGEILAAVGLAQNFAAIRAIVTEGIQKGHMALHARQLAVQLGASDEESKVLIQQLKERGSITLSVAQELLDNIRSKK